jgi:hypothetical protein
MIFEKFLVECDSGLGGGIYTFLKFLGCSSVLLTQRKVIFSLLQMCDSCV